MPLTCRKCGREGEPPPPRRIGFPGAVREKVLATICSDCWKEWEGMEVKVMNEYRLNLMNPEDRATAQKVCCDFLGIEA